MSTVGTLAWARRTQGRMSRRDLAEWVGIGLRSQVALMPGRVAATLGLNKDRLIRFDPADAPVPDSAVAKAAEEACGEMADWLVGHSYRAYLWACALAGHDALRPDPEVLYVACLLHDAGIEPTVEGREDRCFTLASIEIAERIGAGDVVAEAITLHLNPAVPVSQGTEAHLLAAGTALDVAGLRKWEMHPETIAAIHARHPRGDFLAGLESLFRPHAVHAPSCRVATLYRYGAMGPMMRAAWR